MSLLILTVLAIWVLVVMCAVALCAQAGHADDDTAAAELRAAGRFRAVA